MSKGGFFTAYKGESAVWLSEDYHLYHRDNDTARDKRFLDRARKEFINHDDTVKRKIGSAYYVVKFMFDADDELKKSIIERLHNDNTNKIHTDDV